jgi:hypothetical protein
MLDCELLFHSNAEHLSQVYTGFAMLANAGTIKLSQRAIARRVSDPTRSVPPYRAHNEHLDAVVGPGIKLHYDVQDSHDIDADAADEVDFYFKRSFSPQFVAHSHKARILPLGLNYAVYLGGIDWPEWERIVRTRREFKSIVRFIGKTSERFQAVLPFIPTVTRMHSAPMPDQAVRILFMVRAWDPAELVGLTRQEVEDRLQINETRALCIKMLRHEFGERFTGGFQHTAYARKNFGDLLVGDNRLTTKRNYINILHDHPICVATTGLHGSNGWKLAEYVAFSKAIIGETMNHEVPGDFSNEKNYLEFATPERCVENAVRLCEDSHLRHSIMQNNFRYYNEYLRPDVLIKRTLDIALSDTTGSSF